MIIVYKILLMIDEYWINRNIIIFILINNINGLVFINKVDGRFILIEVI